MNVAVWRVFALLFAILFMTSVLSTLILFDLQRSQDISQQQQQQAAKQGYKVVNDVINRLNQIHTETDALISTQGNLSSHQRQVLIQEFQAIEPEGGLATKHGQLTTHQMLQEILTNITKIKQELNSTH